MEEDGVRALRAADAEASMAAATVAGRSELSPDVFAGPAASTVGQQARRNPMMKRTDLRHRGEEKRKHRNERQTKATKNTGGCISKKAGGEGEGGLGVEIKSE